MRVIGTAGHVDHGKSALVAALTGTHPDRLKEEKEREMTIELGFAWFDLPGGESIGIVDVPGHRDFIENMLAGVGGIDAVLLVIAADEGIMPQTREHLAIIDLLQIPSGIIVLSKVDLITDPEWLDLVEAEIQILIQGTVLESAPILRVSSRTGEGIAELIQILGEVLQKQPLRLDLGKPRLPIDRVFSITGFGTVVTGTLLDGSLKLSAEVEILPSGQHGRIRGLQTHKRKEQLAKPGSRVAVNLTGIEVQQVSRGDVLTYPDQYQTTQRLDVAFRLLEQVSNPLHHSDNVKFFLGAMETQARVRVLGVNEVLPGMECWMQLELEKPAVVVQGDRFILRRPSPGETLGGGMVLNPHPGKRHKRFDPAVLQNMETLQLGSPSELLLQTWQREGVALPPDIFSRVHLSPAVTMSAMQVLLDSKDLVPLENGSGKNPLQSWFASADWLEKTTQWTLSHIQKYLRSYPLRRGIPRDELKNQLKINLQVFQLLIKKWKSEGFINEIGTLITLPHYQVAFTIEQSAGVDALLKQFELSPASPPSVKECVGFLGEDLYQALLDQSVLLQVSEDVVFEQKAFQTLKQSTITFLQNHPTLSVAEFRDLHQTSRKYALAFLEYLDSLNITIREGESRRLK